LLDNDVQTLSGGELQRTAIVLALAKPCDIYLIDEPSAYLDSEQRVRASRVMKRWIINSKRSAFVVEHDFIMATYLADKVIVFDGIPAKEAYCTSPEGLVSGMNKFLKLMDITFRRDPSNYRPRINKLNSQKDQEQKSAGNYFLMEAQLEEDKNEEEKDGKKLKATKSGQEDKGEPVLADVKLAPTKSAGAAESHVKGGKGDKPDKKSKKDKE
jgi:ATP-binding cassette, sub-family E, member 1